MDKLFANKLFIKVDRYFEKNITSSKKFISKFLYFRPYEDDLIIGIEPGYMKGYVYELYSNTIYVPIEDYEKGNIKEEEIIYLRVKQLICSYLQTMTDTKNYKTPITNEVAFVLMIFNNNHIISQDEYEYLLMRKYKSESIERLVENIVKKII